MAAAHKHRSHVPCLATAILVVTLLPNFLGGDDWPHWCGPSRAVVVAESSGFHPGRPWLSPQPRWAFEADEGSTSPLLADGWVYAMGWDRRGDALHCLDLKPGKALWKQAYPAPRLPQPARLDPAGNRRTTGRCVLPRPARGWLGALQKPPRAIDRPPLILPVNA